MRVTRGAQFYGEIRSRQLVGASVGAAPRRSARRMLLRRAGVGCVVTGESCLRRELASRYQFVDSYSNLTDTFQRHCMFLIVGRLVSLVFSVLVRSNPVTHEVSVSITRIEVGADRSYLRPPVSRGAVIVGAGAGPAWGNRSTNQRRGPADTFAITGAANSSSPTARRNGAAAAITLDHVGARIRATLADRRASLPPASRASAGHRQRQRRGRRPLRYGERALERAGNRVHRPGDGRRPVAGHSNRRASCRLVTDPCTRPTFGEHGLAGYRWRAGELTGVAAIVVEPFWGEQEAATRVAVHCMRSISSLAVAVLSRDGRGDLRGAWRYGDSE